MDEELQARSFNWQEWVEENRWGILMGLGGLVLVGLGVMMWESGGKSQMWVTQEPLLKLFAMEAPQAL